MLFIHQSHAVNYLAARGETCSISYSDRLDWQEEWLAAFIVVSFTPGIRLSIAKKDKSTWIGPTKFP